MGVTIGDLEGFAKAYPAGPEFQAMREEGFRAGYPSCCVEFFVAHIPGFWAGVPEIEAYWKLAGLAGLGYVPCPECLGAPLAMGLP